MSNITITSDISRKLSTKKFEQGSNITIDIPRDTVYKHLLVRLSGSVKASWSAGSPVSDSTATMSRLINSIDIVSNGSMTIKNVTPWFLQMQQYIATSNFGVRQSSVGSTEVYPTDDGSFKFGTTGQVTSVAESVLVSFENVLAGSGRMSTLWDTRGLASAEMKISTASFLNILEDGNLSTLTDYDVTDNKLEIQVTTIETQNIPLNAYFSAFKQTTKSVAFTAQTNDFLVDINRGNYLQGIMFEVRDIATGKKLSNTLLTDIKLIINGTNYIQNTNFLTIQESNKNRFGLNAPFVGNKSLMDGVCYLDLLTPSGGEKLGALNTAQNVQAPAVDQVQLSLSVAAGCSVRILTNEIVKPTTQN